MRIERHFVNQSHIHCFVVNHDSTGWIVHEEEDSRIIRHAHLDDWHRVERAFLRFERTAADLQQSGWVERTRSS